MRVLYWLSSTLLTDLLFYATIIANIKERGKKVTDLLTKQGILENLRENFKVLVFDEIDSTNLYLKNLAREGAIEGTVIIADSQTLGRGRFDRRFHSPKNCGIYMSILLKPKFAPSDAVLITAAAAVAVSLAVENLSKKQTKIKWVNDVLIDNKKICGILTEGSFKNSDSFDWAVLGIGINAYTPENGFAEDIKNIAGSVFSEPISGHRNQLCAEIINNFWDIYKNMPEKTFLNHYRNRSFVLGKEILVIKNGKSAPAIALEIDDNCRLLVEYKDGTQEFLNSGEISIKL